MSADNYFITDQNGVYFLTFTVTDWVDVFTRKEYKTVIADKDILKKIETEPESRRDWLLYRFEFAGKFDNRIKKYKFWQETNHAILLDTNEMIEQRINYTHENPVRAMIVWNQEDYLFSSARDFAGEKGYVNVQIEL